MELKSYDVCGRVDAPKNFYEYSVYVAGKDEPVDAADLCHVCGNRVTTFVKTLKRRNQKRKRAATQ